MAAVPQQPQQRRDPDAWKVPTKPPTSWRVVTHGKAACVLRADIPGSSSIKGAVEVVSAPLPPLGEVFLLTRDGEDAAAATIFIHQSEIDSVSKAAEGAYRIVLVRPVKWWDGSLLLSVNLHACTPSDTALDELLNTSLAHAPRATVAAEDASPVPYKQSASDHMKAVVQSAPEFTATMDVLSDALLNLGATKEQRGGLTRTDWRRRFLNDVMTQLDTMQRRALQGAAGQGNAGGAAGAGGDAAGQATSALHLPKLQLQSVAGAATATGVATDASLNPEEEAAAAAPASRPAALQPTVPEAVGQDVAQQLVSSVSAVTLGDASPAVSSRRPSTSASRQSGGGSTPRPAKAESRSGFSVASASASFRGMFGGGRSNAGAAAAAGGVSTAGPSSRTNNSTSTSTSTSSAGGEAFMPSQRDGDQQAPLQVDGASPRAAGASASHSMHALVSAPEWHGPEHAASQQAAAASMGAQHHQQYAGSLMQMGAPGGALPVGPMAFPMGIPMPMPMPLGMTGTGPGMGMSMGPMGPMGPAFVGMQGQGQGRGQGGAMGHMPMPIPMPVPLQALYHSNGQGGGMPGGHALQGQPIFMVRMPMGGMGMGPGQVVGGMPMGPMGAVGGGMGMGGRPAGSPGQAGGSMVQHGGQ